MKSILDPSFRYQSSAHTDLRKTFARIRRANTKSISEASRPDTSNQKRTVHLVTPLHKPSAAT